MIDNDCCKISSSIKKYKFRKKWLQLLQFFYSWYCNCFCYTYIRLKKKIYVHIKMCVLYMKEKKKKKKGGEIGFLCKKNWAYLHLCKFLFSLTKWLIYSFWYPASYLRRHGHYDFCFLIYIFIFYLCLKVLNLFLKMLYGNSKNAQLAAYLLVKYTGYVL